MFRFAFRRFLSAVPTLFIVVTLSFFMMRIAPGGPFHLERPLPPQVFENLNRAFFLDQPLIVQYGHYLWNLMHGDFGPSFIYRDFTVAELIGNSLPYSMTLGFWALLIGVGGGVFVGSLAALKQNSLIDYMVMSVANIGITVPNFVFAPLMSLVFAVVLGWLPAGGWDDGGFRNLVLPVISLALPQFAVFARITRGSMIETLRADHIRTARAYGLPSRTIVIVHALRAALMPVISYLGPTAAGVLTGSVVVETVFSLPGVGRYFVLGALNRDYTLVMGTVVLISIFIIVFNLIVDLLYAVLDPRVRYE
ncbi:oligopeptide ABC transporter permease OppB [Oryzibacter oryziterrae]|uniref:oligopeptide ABC transporter permease OppB n=1 Tax=Oryzibacter oryziterrae TaxID=2766474 RepID=UPI001F0037F7|nr:oligopeptide ABC transporter permease OppB [Oryzibacter oryziterrae]